MEQKKNFKPIQDSDEPISMGKVQTISSSQPIGKSLIELGLQEANAQGEATIKKPIIKAKKVVKFNKVLTLKDYTNHRHIEISPNVFIIAELKSKIELSNFEDFIHASEATVDIIDIIPRLYDTHYNIIKHSSTRFMIGDSVTVDFKYKSLRIELANYQDQPRIIKDIKFVNLIDRTAVIAYLEDGDFYPINELKHYDTDRP